MYTIFMRYNKLVRDRIPEIIKSRGGKAVTHYAGTKEYGTKLREKLLEEASELVKAKGKKASVEEIADVLEVVLAIGAFLKISPSAIEKVRSKKRKERGGFTKRIILESS
jgi:predicted house-cleaning noncanonical NTP pyrophosphatase (MazG superfamily)